MFQRSKIVLVALLAAAFIASCTSGNGNSTSNSNTTPTPSETPKAAATPSNQITEADIAKLKWLEGTWKGTDGKKPFYQTIRFAGTTMVVESFADESMSKVAETSRFELKNGEYGHTVGDQRSAVSSITENSVQFVPAAILPGNPVKGSSFRFERKDDGTWNAILEVPATSSRPASENAYKMEPWKALGR